MVFPSTVTCSQSLLRSSSGRHINDRLAIEIETQICPFFELGELGTVTKNHREGGNRLPHEENLRAISAPFTMPTSTPYRRERPRQQRRRSSSWSHTYRRKSQASRSSYYSEDDDDDDSAYLSASSASEEERSLSSAPKSEEEEHERRRYRRGQWSDRKYRDDDHRRDRHHGGSRSSRHIAEESSRSRQRERERERERERSSHREPKKTPRDRECETTDTGDDKGYSEDPATIIARLQHQLAEAQSINAKLEAKAAKQDKAIKFLFKDNDKLKRKLEESSSRSQGKALRDLCDRNDLLMAENRQLRERYAALASKVNDAEPPSSAAAGTSGRNGGIGNRVSSGATRSTAGSSTATPESPGAGNSSPVPPATASAQQHQPPPPSPVASIPRVASRRRNSMLAGMGGGGFGGEDSQPLSQPQPPLASAPRMPSSRRRNSMLGSGVREIPTSMLQAPPPEFGSDQNNRKDFGGLVGGPPGTITTQGRGEEEDPILGKTFSLNVASPPSAAAAGGGGGGAIGGIKSKAEMAKKKIGLRRASMFT